MEAGVWGRLSDRGDEPRAHARASTRLWGINVLLVEDDPADASLVMGVLHRHPNVSAAHALDSPTQALRQLSVGVLTPNLILLDIHMPRMNGFEFLDALRRLVSMRDVPVALLTTSAWARDVVEARWSSALTYVVKPDTLKELQRRLDRVIRRVVAGR